MKNQGDMQAKPLPSDGIPAGMCRQCGMIGLHENWIACVDALRSQIATLEFCNSALAARPKTGARTSQSRAADLR